MDLRTLLAETSPNPDAPVSEALVRAESRLDEAVSLASHRVRTMHVAKVRRRRRLLLATAAATAASGLAPSATRGPGGPVPSAAAVEVMLAAAQAAGAEDDGWADAAYWHITMELGYLGRSPYRQELWLAHHGNGVLMSTDPEIPTAADGEPLYQETGPSVFTAGGQVDWDGLYALPTSADELADVLHGDIRRGDSTWDADTQLWVIVTDLLRFSPGSSALRRALWEVAATIPGVELVGDTVDALGRPGVALERDMSDQGLYRARLIVDPDTGHVLEELSYTLDGTVDYRMTGVDQGPAATAPSPDPPSCGPGSEPHRSC